MIKISIVIITFNSFKYIKSCLQSVFNQTCSDFEVIVVDNNSVDGTLEFIKKYYPQASIIENPKNIGAAKARNQGIEFSKGKYILTLDCDVVLEKNFLSLMVRVAEDSEENVGMIQPKIFKKDKKKIYSVGIHLSFFRRFFDIGKDSFDNEHFNSMRNVFGACSAAACYKRQMLEDIKEDTGYFDERFFFLVEDVDLSWRAQRKGWKALFYPETVCFHDGNSSGLDRKYRQYLCFRNRYYTIKKNEGFMRYAIKFLPVLFYDFPRICFMLLSNRHFLTCCLFRSLNEFWRKLRAVSRIVRL